MANKFSLKLNWISILVYPSNNWKSRKCNKQPFLSARLIDSRTFINWKLRADEHTSIAAPISYDVLCVRVCVSHTNTFLMHSDSTNATKNVICLAIHRCWLAYSNVIAFYSIRQISKILNRGFDEVNQRKLPNIRWEEDSETIQSE